MSESESEICSICLSDDSRPLIQLCETCKPSLTCSECLSKYINGSRWPDPRRGGSGLKCMICKEDAQRLKYYFAGKMENIIEDGCERLPDTRIIMRETKIFKNLEEPIKYKKYKDYIVVGPCLLISSYTCDKCGGKPEQRKGHYPMECADCGYEADIDYGEDGGDYIVDHGFTLNEINLEKKSEKNRKILNARNKEMIMNCEVFSLEINQEMDCERSKVEFGQAEILGKILLIYFAPTPEDNVYKDARGHYSVVDNSMWEDDGPTFIREYEKYFDENNIDYQSLLKSPEKKSSYIKLYYHHVIYLPRIKKESENLKNGYSEFYLYIQDCLDSINKLDDRMKELVIYCHPVLSWRFKGGYKEYISYLRDIASYKIH